MILSWSSGVSCDAGAVNISVGDGGRRDRLVRDKRAAEHDVHIEQAFAIQRFRHVVAGLLHQALLFFRERGALFSPDDEKAVCPVPMLEGNPEQRLRARRNQAEANRAPALLIVRGGRCSDGGGRQCSEDGLNITRGEASCGMADQRALVTMEHGGERRVDRQLVDARMSRSVGDASREWVYSVELWVSFVG